METNTVLLSIKDYNDLRDFKENIIKNNTFFVGAYNGYYPSYQEWVSTDKAIIDLQETNSKLMAKIKELESGSKKEPTINEIKKMSIWQFLKWRKK